MRPHAAGAYANTLSHDEAQRTGDAYSPVTYARLAALKRRYDPTNMFRHNQNIVPDPLAPLRLRDEARDRVLVALRRHGT
jgi:hypothetical protein